LIAADGRSRRRQSTASEPPALQRDQFLRRAQRHLPVAQLIASVKDIGRTRRIGATVPINFGAKDS